MTTSQISRIDVVKVYKELETIYEQAERYDSEYAFLRRGKTLSFKQTQKLLD